MPIYKVSNVNAGTQQNLSTAYKTLLGINAATGATTLRRGWIMEWEIGAADVPNATNCPINWDISTMTAAGTATATTPLTDDSDAAALLTYSVNYTAEPTVTAATQQWGLPLNQQASIRVQMRDEISAIITPAVNLKGPVCRAKSPNYASIASFRALCKE